MRKIFVLAACAVLVAACGSEEAPKPAKSAALIDWQNFERADTNRDGKLSRSEADAGPAQAVKRNFEQMDADKDGFVTKAERELFAKNKAR